MTQLNPYVTFNGNCREAMTFYQACLGGELTLQTVGESPMKDQMQAEMHSNVMHSLLKKDGIVIMASDMMGPGELVRGNSITLCINGGSPEELKAFFAKLSQGGKVGHDLKEEFFGTYGDLTDKFGINWMFQADNA